MTDAPCPTQGTVLAELDRLAPDAPFLALGQTVFWDEPMKAAVVLEARRQGMTRRFIAGVHDTDYFAKFPQPGRTGGFRALPHNDTTTKGLWSAAGEFSALFGSETVVSRETLQSAGAKLARVAAERPGILDDLTEAWGWRGVISLHREHRITAEKPMGALFPTLFETFEWAIDTSLGCLTGPGRAASASVADRLRAIACDAADDRDRLTLGAYYRRLLPELYDLAAGQAVGVETTATTELLRLSPETATLPRFDLFGLFVDPATAGHACAAYDAAVAGSEIYTLDRFGVGAVPFDLYIPGRGRGTLRLGTRGGVVMTPVPVGFSYKTRPKTTRELAEVLDRRFGPGLVLVGKAVTLIGMLAREFVFVFHEGASGYVDRSRRLHQSIQEWRPDLAWNPILRIQYEPWDALAETGTWFRLPEPLRRPFGAEEVSGDSFAARWRDVAAEQATVLKRLAALRRAPDLIHALRESVGGTWSCLASAYESVQAELAELDAFVQELRQRKAEVVQEIRAARARRQAAEQAKGAHWRERIFERSPTPEDWAERERLASLVDAAVREVQAADARWRALQDEQDARVGSEATRRAVERRRRLTMEAEIMRMTLIREAVIASRGLVKAGHRPAAWWFPLVSPDGAWFRATTQRARFWLESLA